MKTKLLTTSEQIISQVENAVISLGQCRQSKLTFEKLLKIALVRKHESIMEYINLTFLIEGISFTSHVHLIRHRLTTPMCQSSRVELNDIEIVIPESVIAILNDKDHTLNDWCYDVKKMYKYLIGNNVPAEDARYLLPQGVKINMAIHMNLREFKHVIKMRTAVSAHWEIRSVVESMIENSKDVLLLKDFLK